LAIPIISAISLDLGTTAIKAGLLDGEGVLGSIVSRPAPEITTYGERYESDALAYALAAERILEECIALAGNTAALGICCQRSSFLLWERAGGRPVTPLISWQDTRGAASCAALGDSAALIRDLTGLRLTPYYFAPKLRVLLLEHPEWRLSLERGELLAGTLDTFLIWRWTGGKHHVTDASMAARTLLMDVRLQRWSTVLCELFGIPLSMLPEIKPSAGLNLPLVQGPILQASLADQSAALIASVGENPAEALVNLGTGGFVIRYLEQGKSESRGYLRTLVYQDGKLRTHFAVEGTLNSIGAALAPYPAGECRFEQLAETGIFCLAEPSGIGAPYFRSDLGLVFSEPVERLTPHQLACLLMEGIVFRVARILEDFHRQFALDRVYLSGGLSGLSCLQQGIAQCAPCDVYWLQQTDSSLRGAALLAAGMPATLCLQDEKVAIPRNNAALSEKYRRWEKWLDGLLELPLL
jgi:glycerol kinase